MSIFEEDKESHEIISQRMKTDTSLSRFLAKLDFYSRSQFEQVFLELFQKGESSKKITSEICNRLGLNPEVVFGVVNNETLNAYREATRQTHQDFGVKYYTYKAIQDDTTSLICWYLYNRKFKTSEKVIHPKNCRCVLIPISENSVEEKTGTELFSQLGRGWKMHVMGKKRFDFYEKGLTLDDLIQTENINNVYRFKLKTISELKTIFETLEK